MDSLVEHGNLALLTLGGHKDVEFCLETSERFGGERVLGQGPAKGLVLRFLFEGHYEGNSETSLLWVGSGGVYGDSSTCTLAAYWHIILLHLSLDSMMTCCTSHNLLPKPRR